MAASVSSCDRNEASVAVALCCAKAARAVTRITLASSISSNVSPLRVRFREVHTRCVAVRVDVDSELVCRVMSIVRMMKEARPVDVSGPEGLDRMQRYPTQSSLAKIRLHAAEVRQRFRNSMSLLLFRNRRCFRNETQPRDARNTDLRPAHARTFQQVSKGQRFSGYSQHILQLQQAE